MYSLDRNIVLSKRLPDQSIILIMTIMTISVPVFYLC